MIQIPSESRNSPYDWLRWARGIRRGGSVKRWHTTTVIGEHLVSSHSWGVATLVWMLKPDCRPELLMAALTHDVAEHWLGDLPAQVKWHSAELARVYDGLEEHVNMSLGVSFSLTVDEDELLKICDMLELLFFTEEQIMLGNSNMHEVRRRVHTWFSHRRATLPSLIVDFACGEHKHGEEHSGRTSSSP